MCGRNLTALRAGDGGGHGNDGDDDGDDYDEVGRTPQPAAQRKHEP